MDIITLINDEDALVPAAVRETLPQLAVLVDHAVAALASDHRVHYIGAGTSGRLATVDAAELLPTFGLEPGHFLAHQAGGPRAFLQVVENAEDNAAAGIAQMQHVVRSGDVVIGLAASGRTPFVVGAIQEARKLGAITALISSNPDAVANAQVDVPIPVDTGPEVLAGSTRMKAATALKLLLNAFSTAVMIKRGATYSNLMVNMVATNAKLRGRSITMLHEATGLPQLECEQALLASSGEVKTALVHLLAEVDVDTAREALERHEGHVRAALAELSTR
jgi:N-acetylmuramic acid 6-phosphate etherase